MIKPAEIDEITQKLREKIAAKGFEGGGVEVAPYDGPCREDCPICQGLGWYRLEVPYHHPDFGKLKRCPNVSVWKLAGAGTFGMDSAEVEGLTWDSILPMFDGRALQAAAVVKQVLERGHGWVYLYGDHGQAKTLILKVAVADWLRANKMAAYANMADVISHIQRAFDQDDPNTESEQRLEFWANLPLLALDEFNRFNKTQWANTAQFRLMDERNVQAIRGQSITLIASNQPPEELDSYYKSRILDGRFITIPLYGHDARPSMTHNDRF